MALILIVDDSPTEVHVMQKALERHGYKTASAGDGAEAIRKAKEMKPDLIFMDVVMPGVNGFQATRKLATRPGHQVDPGDHGDLEGPGDRPHLGHAPGRRRLPGEAGVDGKADREGTGRPCRVTPGLSASTDHS